MATRLSDTPMAENLNLRSGVLVPFTAYLKADPAAGKERLVAYRDMQKMSAWIEDILSTPCTDGVEMDFAKPVAFTPQFGQKTARFTVHGHACNRDTFAKQPIESVNVDHNEILTGYDASNKWNGIPKAALDSVCTEIKNRIESLTNLTVYRLDVAGFIYGEKGVHFPV